MSNLDEILQLAHKRATDNNFPYAGALTPRETFELLQGNSEVILVDVRTQAELELVGRVPNAMNIEWATFPGMVKNQDFANQLADNVDKNLTVIFMCRTGGRSHNAAVVAEQLGFDKAYNMLEGFEGEANELKQRTLINGWKNAGLPWTN
ncbi:MAG: rhodanese-like domain-containing protein [Methylotenera sp.]|uniref:rhodanese-like domain-containing protein n=1 Tax=Methylotenera sp. TaxID=2051956 RepID=UPI002489EE8E|nr:rhodanese-like domain-containing protein [Methylotenera sp.]MDI1308706.1 rhodanese-like domain-containing protein [Methylotenera sp.]